MWKNSLGILTLAASLLTACHTDMYEQPRYEPLEPSAFFSNGMSARDLPAGVVPRGALASDGLDAPESRTRTTFPMSITPQMLSRGEERYNIYCTPCHGILGNGRGKVVERGFKAPESFHSARLRQAPLGHFYDVITNGFGVMYDYRGRIKPEDRWAIIAYIRALQLSQHATSDVLTERDRRGLP